MAIDSIDKSALTEILAQEGDVCISVYLPMARKGPEIRGNAVRLKNALSEVTDTLKERGLGQKHVDALLAEPAALLDDTEYWNHQEDGLALFISPDFSEIYRLPLDFEPLTVVSNRFHIKPLLPLFSEDGTFHILALSQNKVRLLRATRHSVEQLSDEELEAAEIPKSIDEALAYDDPEEQLQHHTSTSGSKGGPDVVHHGHAVEDEERLRLRRFMQQVAKGVARLLTNEEGRLILAAVGYLHPIYRDVDKKANLMEKGIEGNPEHLNAETLHKKALEIAAPVFEMQREKEKERFNALAHSGQATDDLQTIVPAAVQGRVESLFVALNDHAWGQYDPAKNAINLLGSASDRNGEEDLLDFAAVHTLTNGGNVYAVDSVEVPGQKPIAAILRY